MRTEQQAQSRRLSVHADSLAARNAELNRQLQGLVVQIDGKVQLVIISAKVINKKHFSVLLGSFLLLIRFFFAMRANGGVM